MRKVCKRKAREKYRQGSQKSYQTKRESRGDEEMKPEEALKELSYGDTAYGGNCTYEVRMVAVKALKKQIPMKLNNIKSILDFSDRYYTTKGNCPVCKREGLYKSDFYCNKCGQKLDWSEEK